MLRLQSVPGAEPGDKAAMLRWLFGKKNAAASKIDLDTLATRPKIPSILPKRIDIREINPGLLVIPTLEFSGSYTRSPNGRFRIAWHGGNHTDGRGSYVLIDGDVITCRGRTARPDLAKAADNGVFILNSWNSDAPYASRFKAYRPDGSVIISQAYAAIIFSNGLSADGRFAACQTCNSDSKRDSAILTVFDLVLGKELHRFSPESGWPTRYSFSPDGDTVILNRSDDDEGFAYKLDGTFIDRDRWIHSRLKAGDIYVVEKVMRETRGAPAQDTAERLLQSLALALSDHHLQDSSRAFALRLQGEVFEAEGALEKALESYTQAMAINPKIGVKRRVDSLRKKLGVAPDPSPP